MHQLQRMIHLFAMCVGIASGLYFVFLTSKAPVWKGLVGLVVALATTGQIIALSGGDPGVHWLVPFLTQLGVALSVTIAQKVDAI